MSPLSTDEKGQIAVCKVCVEAIKRGAELYFPTTPVRYDLIMDYQGKLYRAQVKYADGKCHHATGVIPLHLRKRKGRCYTRDEIDVLLVYIPSIDRVCWFGPEIFDNKMVLHLRLTPARNNQRSGCLMVQDHLW